VANPTKRIYVTSREEIALRSVVECFRADPSAWCGEDFNATNEAVESVFAKLDKAGGET
jgi:hypothetical protein